MTVNKILPDAKESFTSLDLKSTFDEAFEGEKNFIVIHLRTKRKNQLVWTCESEQDRPQYQGISLLLFSNNYLGSLRSIP